MLPKFLHSDRNKIITGVLLVFVPIFSYTYQFPFFQNCLNIKSMMLIYAAVGIALGVYFANYYSRDLHFPIEKFQLHVALIVIGLILVPLIGSLINRAIPLGSGTEAFAEVQRVDAYSESRFGELELSEPKPDGIFVFVMLEGKPVRLDADLTYDVDRYGKGSTLPVMIKKGILGLRWVELME